MLISRFSFVFLLVSISNLSFSDIKNTESLLNTVNQKEIKNSIVKTSDSNVNLYVSLDTKGPIVRPDEPFDKVISLSSLFKLAKKHNSTYQSAKKTYLANQEIVPITLGTLLPNINANYSISRVNTKIYDTPTNIDNTNNQHSANISLNQQIFNWSLWQTYSQSEYQKKAYAIILAKSLQDLVLDVGYKYFEVLNINENLRFSDASVKWNKELLIQTNDKYEVGIAARPELEAAKAQYENALSDNIFQKNNLKTAFINLYKITGKEDINAIQALKSSFKFDLPNPNSESSWTKQAEISNLTIVQNQFLETVAEKNIDIVWGTFLPSVNLGIQASRGIAQITNTTIKNIAASASVNWNILNGGSDIARYKQSEYAHQTTEFALQQSIRNAKSLTNQSYLNLVSDTFQISAYKQSVLSNEISVKAMKEGYLVGTQTIVDLLQQQRLLLQAQLQYSNAKYKYINDYLQLKYNVGILTEKDLSCLNHWLQNGNGDSSKSCVFLNEQQ